MLIPEATLNITEVLIIGEFQVNLKIWTMLA